MNGINTRLSLQSNSNFTGKQIVIQAANSSVYLDSTSHINVAGRSNEIVGTTAGQGAAFLGEGGYCGGDSKQVFKCYGLYNSTPSVSTTNQNVIRTFTGQIGSMGASGDTSTWGGGRVVIFADNLILEGQNDKIVAHGYPLFNSTLFPPTVTRNGGSGGYIFIKVYHKYNQSSIEQGSRIMANGGYGTNGGLGGAGGLIVLEKLILTSEFVQAQPGQSLLINGQVDGNLTSGCKHGAPGAIYSQDLDVLSINKNGTFTTKRIYLYGNNSNILQIGTLDMKNHTHVVLFNTNQMLIGSQFRTNFNNSLTLGTNSASFVLKLGMLTTIDPSMYAYSHLTTLICRVFNFTAATSVQISSTFMYIFQCLSISFKNQISITAQSIIINGVLHPITFPVSQIQLKASTDITLYSSVISASKIALLANRNILIDSIAGITLNTQSLSSIQGNLIRLGQSNVGLYQPNQVDYDLFINANGTFSTSLESPTVNFTASKVGMKVGGLTINGALKLRALQSSQTIPNLNIIATLPISFPKRVQIVSQRVQIQGDGVSFLQGLIYDINALQLPNLFQQSPVDPASYQFTLLSLTKPIQILYTGTPSLIRTQSVLIQSNSATNGSIILQNTTVQTTQMLTLITTHSGVIQLNGSSLQATSTLSVINNASSTGSISIISGAITGTSIVFAVNALNGNTSLINTSVIGTQQFQLMNNATGSITVQNCPIQVGQATLALNSSIGSINLTNSSVNAQSGGLTVTSNAQGAISFVNFSIQGTQLSTLKSTTNSGSTTLQNVTVNVAQAVSITNNASGTILFNNTSIKNGGLMQASTNGANATLSVLNSSIISTYPISLRSNGSGSLSLSNSQLSGNGISMNLASPIGFLNITNASLSSGLSALQLQSNASGSINIINSTIQGQSFSTLQYQALVGSTTLNNVSVTASQAIFLINNASGQLALNNVTLNGGAITVSQNTIQGSIGISNAQIVASSQISVTNSANGQIAVQNANLTGTSFVANLNSTGYNLQLINSSISVSAQGSIQFNTTSQGVLILQNCSLTGGPLSTSVTNAKGGSTQISNVNVSNSGINIISNNAPGPVSITASNFTIGGGIQVLLNSTSTGSVNITNSSVSSSNGGMIIQNSGNGGVYLYNTTAVATQFQSSINAQTGSQSIQSSLFNISGPLSLACNSSGALSLQNSAIISNIFTGTVSSLSTGSIILQSSNITASQTLSLMNNASGSLQVTASLLNSSTSILSINSPNGSIAVTGSNITSTQSIQLNNNATGSIGVTGTNLNGSAIQVSLNSSTGNINFAQSNVAAVSNVILQSNATGLIGLQSTNMTGTFIILSINSAQGQINVLQSLVVGINAVSFINNATGTIQISQSNILGTSIFVSNSQGNLYVTNSNLLANLSLSLTNNATGELSVLNSAIIGNQSLYILNQGQGNLTMSSLATVQSRNITISSSMFLIIIQSNIAGILPQAEAHTLSQINPNQYSTTFVSGMGTFISQVTVRTYSFALMAGTNVQTEYFKLTTTNFSPSPNVAITGSTGALNFTQTNIVGYMIRLQSQISCTLNMTTIVSLNTPPQQSISDQNYFIQVYITGSPSADSIRGFWQQNSQIQASNMVIRASNGGLTMIDNGSGLKNQWLLSSTSMNNVPTLIVSVVEAITLTNLEVFADQINMTAATGVSIINTNLTAVPATKQINVLTQTTPYPGSDLYIMTIDGPFQMININVYCSGGYFEAIGTKTIASGALTIQSSNFTAVSPANIANPYPAFVLNATSIELSKTNQINASRAHFFASKKISNLQQTSINAYQAEYARGLIPTSSDFQIYFQCDMGDIVLTTLSARGYNTAIVSNGGSVILQSTLIARFDDTNTNYIGIRATNNVQATSLQTASAFLDIIGPQSVSLNTLDIKVNTKGQVDITKYSFNILSQQGPITIQGSTNRYFCRDINVQAGGDITINFITLLMTNFVTGVIPNINVQSSGNLVFQEPSSISGGNMIFRGAKSLSFAAQTSLLASYQSGILPSPDNYTLYLLSDQGPIHCEQCHLASEGNISVSAGQNLTGTSLKIEADTVQPNNATLSLPTLIVSAGSINLTQMFQVVSRMVSVTTSNGPIIGNNFSVNSTLQSPPSPGQYSTYIESAYGQSVFNSGIVTGQTIWVGAQSLTCSDVIFQAQGLLQSGYNIEFDINQNLSSLQNITIIGGQIFLSATSGVMMTNGFTIFSDPTLIQYPSQSFDIAIISQGLVYLQQTGVLIANQSILIQSLGVQGEARIINTQITCNDSVTILSQGNLWMLTQTNISANRVNITSYKEVNIQDRISVVTLQSDLSIPTYFQLYGYETIQTSNFSIRHFGNVQIHSNNSIVLGQGIYRMHELDVKSKAYARMEDLVVYQSRSVFMSSNNITLKNVRMTIDSLQTISNNTVVRLLAYGYLKIQEQSIIRSGANFLMGQQGLGVSYSTVTSVIPNTCNMDSAYTNNLFYCIKKSSIDLQLSESKFIQAFNQQFYNTQISLLNQTFSYIEKNFTTYVLSFGQISFTDSFVQTSRFGTCSSDLIFRNASVSSNGKGCSPDQGLGKGVFVQGCSGSGASSAGIGGFGSQNTTNLESPDCSQQYPNPYNTREIDVQFEGSGGASAIVPNQTNYTRGGSGGGIIWLSAANHSRILNSTILAEGEDGQLLPGVNATEVGASLIGSGGGSGGSIQILTSIYDGDGYLSVQGGKGSIGGGGGGSGGRIVMDFLGNYLKNFYDQHTYNWTGSISLLGGSGGLYNSSFLLPAQDQASNGTEWHPPCLAGYSGAFCSPCPIGTYKYGYSYGICLPCQNKPDAAFYTNKAVQIAYCPYECNSGLAPMSQNADCVNHIELQIQNIFGDMYLTLGVLGGFLFITMVQWIRLVQSKTKLLQSKIALSKFYIDIDGEDDQVETSTDSISLTDQTYLRYHTYRLYFMGLNSSRLPWIVPTDDIPIGTLSESDQIIFDTVIRNNFPIMQWTSPQCILCNILTIIFPPFGQAYYDFVQRSKLRRLQRILLLNMDPDFWGNHLSNQSVRLGIAAPQQCPNLAYFDFVDFAKTFKSDEYSGPKLPLVSMISGAGSFESPYMIDYESDPSLKLLIHADKKRLKRTLPAFYQNLNALLGKLNFNKFTGLVLKDLDILLEHIEKSNKEVFYKANMKVTLYLFDNSYNRLSFEQKKRKSFPIDSKLFQAFPGTYAPLIAYIKYKVMRMQIPNSGSRNEIRFGLVFQKLTEQRKKKEQQLEELISKYRRGTIQEAVPVNEVPKDEKNEGLLEKVNVEEEAAEQRKVFEQVQYSYNISIQRRDTMLDDFLDDEEDDYGFQEDEQSEEEIQKNINEALDDDTVDQNESKKGRDSVRYKIVESSKRKRAYSLSKEAALTLQEAIKKPRLSCKHKLTRTVAFFYSLFLMIFKSSSKPPKKGSYLIFFLYSFLVALDILVSLSFAFHLSFPTLNFSPTTIVYVLIYPCLPLISPIIGILATLLGSTKLMKWHIQVNMLLCLMNYPLTMVVQAISKSEQMFYIFEILTLYLNKVLMQFFISKVIADFENPYFGKNTERIKAGGKLEEDDDSDDDE